MTNDSAVVGSFFIGALLTFIVMAMILCQCWDSRYKKGQVDVLTGNTKFELITHPDSTKSWEKIRVVEGVE